MSQQKVSEKHNNIICKHNIPLEYYTVLLFLRAFYAIVKIKYDITLSATFEITIEMF